MTVYFNDRYLENLYENNQGGKPKYSQAVIKKFRLRVNFLIEAKDTMEVRAMKRLHFERLVGDKQGLYAIRVTKSYRLEFAIDKKGKVHIEEVIKIHELSNHYK